MVSKEILDFLDLLSKNNNREWFTANKAEFQKIEKQAKFFFNDIGNELQKSDSIENIQMYRIYRDVRFSKDKSPYKNYLGAWYSRTKPFFRGSYYVHLEPGNCFVEGGFWMPNAEDLKRIRKEFELDDSEIREIINSSDFKKYFGTIRGEELKTAPKDFDKSHKAIDLIRKKQFLAVRKFTDAEVLDKSFNNEVFKTFAAMRPYFDYMSDVLTTNLNGESIIK
ncbi:DUF2461 domain-containing protein [Flavobacterium sp. AG291]|uniref:DUF2461 domain-containing protein n=1 Tax=Flavobacterium sp. AG291 TaxID=2184000 RepID=UPI000E0BDFD7|nr:DUF2461 domain-containing protein [Flavobacterium sp. AG291]RDI14390.1 uncharacterized protein (TIGR02453 family) [Flavobacterium sp. AG291]